MNMQLFFHLRGRTNIEYEVQEDSWKVIPFGSYSLQLINAMLDVKEDGRKSDALLTRLIEMAGAKDEKEAIGIIWPVILLSCNLMAGRDSNLAESIGVLGAGKGLDLLPYFTGQETVLWEKWLFALPLPSLIKEGRFGWQCKCNTVAEAAIVEMVLGFFYGWKRKFRFCRKCQRLHHGKDCNYCLPEAKEKKKFQGLLRQHKNRYRKKVNQLKKGSARREELEAAISSIEKLLKKLQSGTSLRTILKEYEELCSLYHLPQRWVKSYNKRRIKNNGQ